MLIVEWGQTHFLSLFQMYSRMSVNYLFLGRVPLRRQDSMEMKWCDWLWDGSESGAKLLVFLIFGRLDCWTINYCFLCCYIFCSRSSKRAWCLKIIKIKVSGPVRNLMLPGSHSMHVRIRFTTSWICVFDFPSVFFPFRYTANGGIKTSVARLTLLDSWFVVISGNVGIRI